MAHLALLPHNVSRHRRAHLCFPSRHRCQASSPLLSPCAGPGASLELRVVSGPKEPTPSPLLSSGAVDCPGELRISIARPSHWELVLSAVLGRCGVVHGRRSCSPSRRSTSRQPHLTAPRCTLCTSSSCQSCHGTHAASHVGVGLGNPRAPCRTTTGQATPCSAGSLRGARCRHLAASEPARTVSFLPVQHCG
jgi:hypothetical protein